ncbi:hypothetical protein L0152_23820 [bacterium]|nr:hypothetical protein [bacterium]
MKVWIVFIPLFWFCSLAFAEVRIYNGKMTVDVVDQRLDKILSVLREQSDIQFYVDDTVIDQSICADFQNLSIGRGIKKLLEGTGINHAVIAKNGETQAIFIGGSLKPQPSSAKLDARSTTPRPKQTIYRPPTVQRTQPAKNTVIESKKKQPANRIEPVVSIPTAGNLTTTPAPKEKQKKE